MSVSALVDLSGGLRLTPLDLLFWFGALSVIGLAVLLVGGAVFAAVLWTAKGIVVGARATGRGCAAGLRIVVEALRKAPIRSASRARG